KGQRRLSEDPSFYSEDGDIFLSQFGERSVSFTPEQYQCDGRYLLPQCADVLRSRGSAKGRSQALPLSSGWRMADRQSERGLAGSLFAVHNRQFSWCDPL